MHGAVHDAGSAASGPHCRTSVHTNVRRLPSTASTTVLADIAHGDSRHVVTNATAGYFGARVDDTALVPAGEARIAGTDLDAWLARHAPAR